MNKKQGILVIHGIGDPAPGEALQHLTDALAAGKLRFQPVELYRLPSPNLSKPNLYDFFPMALRRGRVATAAPTDADDLVFAEVFWGSASQLPGGWRGVVEGVIQLFFRSHVIIRYAAPAKGQPATWLQRTFFTLAQIGSYLLTGPIFAMNILLLLALACYQFFKLDNSAELAVALLNKVFGWTIFLAFVVAAVVFGIYRYRKHSVFQHLVVPAIWLSALALAWLVVATVRSPQTLSALVTTPTVLFTTFFLLIDLILMLLILLRGLHWFTESTGQPMQLLRGPTLTVALVTLLIQYGLWVVVIPTLWFILLERVSDNNKVLHQISSELAQADGVQWVSLAVIGFFGLLTLAWRWLSTRQLVKQETDRGPTARESARLIIHRLISVPLAVTTLAIMSLILLHTLPPLIGMPSIAFVESTIKVINEWHVTARIVPFVLLAVPLLGGPLRLALDLVNDIIAYVDENAEGAKRTAAMPTGEIRRRFGAVISYLQENETIADLTVIAHSQGSVIALDELADPQRTMLDDYQGRLTFITIGSPISHLYQNYFPDAYPRWEHRQRWQTLFARLQRWHHYYRVDDYVGMRINQAPSSDRFTFTQSGLGTGAHNDYWRDKRFITELEAVLHERYRDYGGQ